MSTIISAILGCSIILICNVKDWEDMAIFLRNYQMFFYPNVHCTNVQWQCT